MLRFLAVFVVVPAGVFGQSLCPPVNFLNARTVNLKPSATSHVDLVRQTDGSYTGFEVADRPPYRTLATTSHFERQFADCLPRPPVPNPTPPAGQPPPGTVSQPQVAAALAGGNYFAADISDDHHTIHFDIFDAQHNLLSETTFTHLLLPSETGYGFGIPNESFYSLALADLDLDGKLDLIALFSTRYAGSLSNGGVWTFPGNGDGTFRTGTRQVFTDRGQLMAAVSVAIGDLNGDKFPDLILAQPAGVRLTVALGNGDTTFRLGPPTDIFIGGSDTSQLTVLIADLNGDGKGDLVLSQAQGPNGNIAVAFGTGDGSLQPPVLYDVVPIRSSAVVGRANIAVGDVNGDRYPDIVTASGTILFGDGAGRFVSRRDYLVNSTGSVLLADANGDGITDILIGSGSPAFLSGSAQLPALTLLLGEGYGSFTGAPLSGTATTKAYPQSSATADFNGDGLLDFAFVTPAEEGLRLATFFGQRSGQFVPGPGQSMAAKYPNAAGAADFNRDGKQDLAVVTSVYPNGSQIQVFLGNGDGSFRASVTTVLSSENIYRLAVHDFNGDGLPDLLVPSETGVFIRRGKGDGSFSPSAQRIEGTSPAVAVGDVNRDGRLDLVIATTRSAELRVHLGRGDGTFAAPVTSTLPGLWFGDAPNLILVDFDRDGRLDLALNLPEEGSGPAKLVVLLGRGDGTFPLARVSLGGLTQLATIDLNSDGLPDLIGTGLRSQQSYRLGNGDGTFQPEVVFFAFSFAVGITDFNQDGMPDLVGVVRDQGIVALRNLAQPPPALSVVSAATFIPGALAPGIIATAFGRDFGSAVTGLPFPIPNSVPGLTISIQDSTGAIRPAPLLFASQTQANFFVPKATALGPATITVVTAGTGKVLSVQVQIAAASPALFAVGAQLAAAQVVRVTPDGRQTVAPVFIAGADGGLAPLPIDLAQPGQVYLVLYGTGFDAATTSSTNAAVQGLAAAVIYAGPQSSEAGLDQVNLLLPKELAGTGVANVSITVGGAVSNTVFVTIQ